MSTTTVRPLSLHGRVIDRDDPGYDEARALYNGMIDKRPLLIADASMPPTWSTASLRPREDLPVAIRGGGHNGPGLGSVDDGLMIDLSGCAACASIRARTVRVAAGCTSGDVDHATHAYGLAVPFGIVSTTGVPGSRSVAASAICPVSTA